MSVNPHHNGQKFTDKSPENDGLSVKCVLLTDKSAKIGSLSVNLSEILAHCPKKKKSVPSRHEFSSLFSCVRGHERSLPRLVNRVQTSNKAHDKFMPHCDCACADHSRLSLSTALLSVWSSHLVLIGFRLTTPLSQAPLLGQDELTRRKRDLDTRGLTVRLHTLSNPYTFAQSID